jgi:hypothetical protein
MGFFMLINLMRFPYTQADEQLNYKPTWLGSATSIPKWLRILARIGGVVPPHTPHLSEVKPHSRHASMAGQSVHMRVNMRSSSPVNTSLAGSNTSVSTPAHTAP